MPKARIPGRKPTSGKVPIESEERGVVMSSLPTGVDMSKATFVAAICMNGQESDVGEFVNEAAGFAELHECLSVLQQAHGLETIHLVVEPTGGYELALVVYAYEQGWLVSLPNPKQVRDWAKGIGRRSKTDRQDARCLARFAAERQPAPQQPLPNEVRELDSLLQRRHDLEQLLQQERNRLGDLAGRPGVAAAILPNLEQVIAALEEALKQVEQALAQHLKSYAHLEQDRQRLLALPGVGVRNVLPLLVLLHRWQALTAGQGDSKGISAFAGLDPQAYQSGTSVHRRSTISKMGNPEVRRLLYMGALGGVRGHNPLNTFYHRLVGRGRPKKVALVAASRKILCWAWIIFSRQTTWDPAHFAQFAS
jgi:transposase